MDVDNTEEELIYSRINFGSSFYEGSALAFKQGLHDTMVSDVDNMAVRELRYLQRSSDHAVRNNGYAKTALNKWKTNAGGVKVVWKTANGKKHKLMQGYWDEFAGNPSFDGHGDMCTLQGVSNASLFLSGNSYIRMLIQRTGNTATVPFKLQLIPSVLHDIYHQASEVLPSGETLVTRHGITFKNSVPTVYHFVKSQLAKDEDMFRAAEHHVPVPSEEIVHTFVRETPGQWLGIPMLAPVLLAAYNLDDLLGATINKQQNAQAISMVIEAANNAVSMLPVGDVKKDKTKVKFISNGSNVIYLNKQLAKLEKFLTVPDDLCTQEMALMAYPLVLTSYAIKTIPHCLNNLILFLEKNDIETRPLMPIISQPAYQHLKFKEKDFPIAKQLLSSGFYVGCHQDLAKKDLDYLVTKLLEFFSK